MKRIVLLPLQLSNELRGKFTETCSKYALRPGEYIEHDFPLLEVNRLAQKEANDMRQV